MKKIEHKGWFIACCISLVLAVGCCFCYTATTNMVNKKNEAQAKLEKEIGIVFSEYKKSDITRLENELTEARKTYEERNAIDTSGEAVIKEFIEKRYNYQGRASKKCEEIIEAVKGISGDKVIDDIREEMNMPISGNGPMKEITDHYAEVIEIYLDDNPVIDLGNTPPGGIEETQTIPTKRYYVKAKINGNMIYYFDFTLEGTENNWIVADVFVPKSVFLGGNENE